MEEINKILRKIILLLDEIKNLIESNNNEFELQQIDGCEPVEGYIPFNVLIESDNNELEELKKLLNSSNWPEAVLEFQIADESSEEDKADRAEGIIEILIEEPLKGKKFLDFGCGEGHAAKHAKKEAFVSIGYDIEQSGSLRWEDESNFLLTTNFEKVKSAGPFDIILLYDVLDHSDNPTEVLNQAKSVLHQNGKIYLRCHPWCGRHGGHLYREKNKAFIHLIFTEEELNQLGVKCIKTNKVFYPLKTYKDFIKESGLVEKSCETEEQDIEPFFNKNEIIKNRIMKNFNIKEWSESIPEYQMKQCFIDYVLKK